MERLAVGWLVWQQTGSATWVGAIAALRMGPALILAPIGGVLTDQAGSVRLLQLCHAGNALILGLMALAGMSLSIWAIALAVFLLGALQGLWAAPIKAVIPQIVPRPLLASAVPLSSATFQLAAFVGPAFAGIVLAIAGISVALAIAMAGHVIFALILLRWNDHGVVAEATASPVVVGLVEAVRQCATDPTLGSVFALHLAAAILLRPMIDMMPVVAGNFGTGDATLLGVLAASSGAGALLGAVWMTVWARTDRLTRRAVLASAAAALALSAIALILWRGGPALAAFALFGFGFALVVRSTASLTIVQLVSEQAYRGRIVGVYSSILRGGTALGAILIGLVADLLGLALALALAAAVMVAVVALTAGRLSAANVESEET